MRPMPGRQRAIGVIAALNAVAALAGALGLMTGTLDLTSRIEDRLPWGSPALGGLALAVTVAAPNAWLALLAWRGDPDTGRWAVGVGAALVGWIVVQLAFIRELSFFHPLYLAIGIALVALGWRADATRRRSVPEPR